jgi:double-stranded uracil-DNA glycosylase
LKANQVNRIASGECCISPVSPMSASCRMMSVVCSNIAAASPAVVRRPTRRADEVSPGEFKAARLEFEAKMRRYAPRSIAFLGKRALSAMLGLPRVEWGEFPTGFAGAKAWILPNPSGLNRRFTLDALVDAYSELRRQL